MDEGSTTTKEAEKTVNRITLNNAARVFESQSYAARGDHRTHDEQAVRLSYLGRVHVNKPDLEVVDCPKPLQGSIRLYSSEYGRFLAVDKLWEKYRTLQPYQYAVNEPIRQYDFDGLDSNRRPGGSAKQTAVIHGNDTAGTGPNDNTASVRTGEKKLDVVAGAVGTTNAAQQGMMNMATAGKDATSLGAGVAGYQSALRLIGKATGFLSVAANGSELIEKYNKGEPIQGALAKTLVSVALLSPRVNPWVLIGLGIADAAGVTDSYIYQPIDKHSKTAESTKK